MRLYNVDGNCLNTASTTLPLGNIVGTAAYLAEIIKISLGSDAALTAAARYRIQRGTTVGSWAGTGGAAFTPVATDPTNTVAALTTANQGVCSSGPTLTASSFPWTAPGLNQQAAIIDNFTPGMGVKCLNAASASLNLMSVVAATAFNLVFGFVVSE